jgi:hypothetical protein
MTTFAARADRAYSITVAHFPPERIVAKSPSAARYKAYKALCEAGYRYASFRDFLLNVRTLHLGFAP